MDPLDWDEEDEEDDYFEIGVADGDFLDVVPMVTKMSEFLEPNTVLNLVTINYLTNADEDDAHCILEGHYDCTVSSKSCDCYPEGPYGVIGGTFLLEPLDNRKPWWYRMFID